MRLIKINSVLICLLPISLVLSRFLADLSISICGILFLISVMRKKEWFYFNNKFIYLFSLFLLYIFVRSLFTLNLVSIITAIFYFRFGLFSLAVWHVINNNSKFLKYFFITCITTFLILSLDAVYQYYNGYNIIGYPKHLYNKVGSFFGKTYILGSYILRIFPIILGIFLYKNYSFFKKKYIYVAIILIFAVSSLSVILSGERTALFLFLFYLFSVLILLKLKKFYKIIIPSVIFILSICIFLYDSKIYQRYITEVYDQIIFNYPHKEEGIQRNYSEKYFKFSVHHDLHYQVSYKMFIDNIFFGQGPKMFRILCNDYKFSVEYIYEAPDKVEVFNGCSTHPHNSYIQLFAETGLLGVAFLILFFCYVVLKIFYNFFFSSKISNNIYNYKICILLLFFINFFPIAPNGNFFNNWLSIMYYLPLGFYLQITKGKF